jgi:hypothetical protein
MAQRDGSAQMQETGQGTAWLRRSEPVREPSTYRGMEATMNFFDSTSVVMVLIMAGVFAPIAVIHFLATSVFQ